MTNYNIDLTVLNPSGEKKLPGPTIAQIYVKTHSKDNKGMIYISPQCVTLSEIEEQCDRLIKEIQSIRKKAQKQFRK